MPHFSTTKLLAVVLLINIGDISILLGSDLEETTGKETGWSVIVNSKTRPKGKASLFKIPHHGSVTADNSQVWDEMIHNQPISVLTPFIKGSNRLPTRKDVKRIVAKSQKSYSTSTFKTKRIKGRPKVVEEFIQQTVRSIRPVFSSFGYVRLCVKPDSKNFNWNVDLFGDAIPLNQIYSD